MMHLYCGIILHTLFLIIQAGNINEDCRRDGRPCNNVPCDSSDGSCPCETGMYGRLCQYVEIDAITECGGILTEDSGSLTISGFTESQTCIFLISAPTGNRIVLRVAVADFADKNADCSRDSVEVRNGGTSTSPLVGKYCDKTSAFVINSLSNELWIKFVSDDSVNLGGFGAAYSLENDAGAVTFDPTCPVGKRVISTPKYLEVESLDSDTPASQIMTHTAIDYSGIAANIECVNVCTDTDMTGPDCTTKRVDFSCDMVTGITIANIEPYAPYTHVIKIYGKDACVYSAGVVWALDTDVCLSLIEHPDAATTNYVFLVHITFSDSVTSSTDILLSLICQLSNGVIRELDVTSAGITVDSSLLTKGSDQILVNDAPVATLVISANAGTAGGDVDSLNVGQDFYLVISMPRSAYVAFLVNELVVLSGDESQSEIMVTGGCWTAKAIKFIKEIVTTDTSSTHSILSLKVTAFKFTSHNQLKFKVSLLLCTTSASGSTCELTACVVYTSVTGADMKLGHNGDIARRKRDVQGVSEAVHSGEMTVSVNINQPGLATADGQSQNVSESRMHCLQDVIFLAPLVTLMALLLLSMGTAFYFCSKVNRRNKADAADDYRRGSRGYPMSESGRSGHSSKYPGRY